MISPSTSFSVSPYRLLHLYIYHPITTLDHHMVFNMSYQLPSESPLAVRFRWVR